MIPPAYRHKTKFQHVTCLVTPEVYQAFKRMLPRRGERSKVLAKFVEMYVKGEISFNETLSVNHTGLNMNP